MGTPWPGMSPPQFGLPFVSSPQIRHNRFPMASTVLVLWHFLLWYRLTWTASSTLPCEVRFAQLTLRPCSGQPVLGLTCALPYFLAGQAPTGNKRPHTRTPARRRAPSVPTVTEGSENQEADQQLNCLKVISLSSAYGTSSHKRFLADSSLMKVQVHIDNFC